MRHKPTTQAKPTTRPMPQRMAVGLIQPWAQVRSGPNRSAVSRPLMWSKRSLIKLLATCIKAANAKHSAQGCHCHRPWRCAIAPATSTGAMAAGNVLGRTAKSQARGECGRTLGEGEEVIKAIGRKATSAQGVVLWRTTKVRRPST